MELGEDWEHFEVLMEPALNRIPALAQAGIRQFLNGPESFTPDGRFMLGEAVGLRNFFVATGFNSIGIASAAGAGKALAEWIVQGAAPMDLADIDPRRFQPFEANPRYLRDRTVEMLGLMYAMHWPYRQPETARGVRLTPAHDRLAARGACFGAVAGWERPMWYAPDGVAPRYDYNYGRQNWWQYTAEEASAARQAVALFEQTPFAKFRLEGADAEAVLQRLCANDVGGAPGRAVYTQMLNPRGGIEADLTVTRLSETSFLIVTGSAVGPHDADWMRRNMPADARAVLTDVTSAYAVFGVMGPRARELLARLTDADLSNAAFPFRAARTIDLGYARALAIRVSYVGELGWELYVPSECAMPLFDLLMDEGAALGLRLAGLHAMDSLRLEKAFKHWGHDIAGEDTPLEAGLGFAVAWAKNAPFIGRDALLRQREEGVRKRLVTFTVDDGEPLLLHDEPVWRDGALVGRTTSGNFAFTLGRPIAMGYVENGGDVVDRDWVQAGRYQIEVAGEHFPATPHLRPPYDPKGERLRG
jgi:4-methylaminobutanoate oxidase (formaldehyde-forming)